MPLHTFVTLHLMSAMKSEYQSRVPLQEGLCICVTALQSLEGAQYVRSLICLSPRLKLEVSLKDLLKGATSGGLHAFV